MSIVIPQRAGEGGTLCWVLGIVRAGVDLKEFTTEWRQAFRQMFARGHAGGGRHRRAQTRRPPELLLSEGCFLGREGFLEQKDI